MVVCSQSREPGTLLVLARPKSENSPEATFLCEIERARAQQTSTVFRRSLFSWAGYSRRLLNIYFCSPMAPMKAALSEPFWGWIIMITAAEQCFRLC